MAQNGNSGRQEGGGGPTRDVAISEVGKWVVKGAVILLLVIFGANLVGHLSAWMSWVVERMFGEFSQVTRNLFNLGVNSPRGVENLIHFLAIAGVVAVILRWILRK